MIVITSFNFRSSLNYVVKFGYNEQFFYLLSYVLFLTTFLGYYPAITTTLADLDSISPTYLRTAFTPVSPKSVRIQSSCQYLFTLLGSTATKAARRMLMKLTPEAAHYSGIYMYFFPMRKYSFPI